MHDPLNVKVVICVRLRKYVKCGDAYFGRKQMKMTLTHEDILKTL